MSLYLRNATSGLPVVDRLEIAKTPWARVKGLLGRDGLQAGHGLLIEDCSSIHTWFMRFAIDVVYLDDTLRVRKIVPDLHPWRLSASRDARHVLELPAGALLERPVGIGDILKVEKE